MQTQQGPLAYPFEPGAGLVPHPLHARLREQPLARVRTAYGDEAWLATRYADVKTVLSDPRFSMADAVHGDRPRTRALARVDGGLLALDPPGHTRLRRLVAKDFSARRIGRLHGRIERLAEELLDRIVAAGPPADLVGQLAVPAPTTLFCELLGVPGEDQHRFWTWAESKLSGVATDQEIKAQTEEFFDYLTGLFELRRREPGDDLTSCLLRAADQEGLVTDEEVRAIMGEFLLAGFVTVASQLSNFLYHVLIRPEELERLRQRPDLIPGAVEELTRYVQLNNFLPPRYAVEDVELGGVLVRAGEPVLVSLTAANRDPAVFADGDELVLDRPACPHIGFGHGAHYCLGAHLARLELRVVLEAVLRRLPGLALAVPAAAVRWKTKGVINGVQELPVTFERRPEAATAGRVPRPADDAAGTPAGGRTDARARGGRDDA